MEKLGLSRRPDAAELMKREMELVAFYDKLFEQKEFVQFIYDMSMRSGMFRQSTGPRGEWYEGYSAALRDVVNHCVSHSTHGVEKMAKAISDHNTNLKQREVRK